jgi:hypothetical protein
MMTGWMCTESYLIVLLPTQSWRETYLVSGFLLIRHWTLRTESDSILRIVVVHRLSQLSQSLFLFLRELSSTDHGQLKVVPWVPCAHATHNSTIVFERYASRGGGACSLAYTIVTSGFTCPLPPIDNVIPIEDRHVPKPDDLDFIAKKQLANNTSLVVLTYYTEILPLLQIVWSVSTSDGQRQQTTLVDCAAMLDFVSEDFVRRMSFQMRKLSNKTPIRLELTSSCYDQGVWHSFHCRSAQISAYVSRSLRFACGGRHGEFTMAGWPTSDT